MPSTYNVAFPKYLPRMGEVSYEDSVNTAGELRTGIDHCRPALFYSSAKSGRSQHKA